MTAITIAGSSLAISAGLPVTNDAAGFAAVTPTPVVIGEITSFGARGRTYTIVPHLPLSERRAKKAKGSYDEGDPSYSLAIDKADAGQVIAEAALLSDNNYTFKETDQAGNVFWFVGKVTSFQRAGGDVNTIDAASLVVAIDGDVVPVLV
jgi:hypothetical protein